MERPRFVGRSLAGLAAIVPILGTVQPSPVTAAPLAMQPMLSVTSGAKDSVAFDAGNLIRKP